MPRPADQNYALASNGNDRDHTASGTNPLFTSAPILDPEEPPAVEIINPAGKAPFLLLCEHAGNAIPRSLGDLGISAADLNRHIAWDPGAQIIARGLSEQLDATLILQPYSRLVIDCNRPRNVTSLVPVTSDGTSIPANAALDMSAIEQRWQEIHQVFHNAVVQALDQNARRALISIHSFTPMLSSSPQPRLMDAGLLYGSDTRLADAMLAALEALDQADRITRNQPYAVDEESDYAIPVHGIARGIPNVLIELRQDLISNAPGQQSWIAKLTTALAHPLTQALLKEAFA